jgi:hypothetical protein
MLRRALVVDELLQLLLHRSGCIHSIVLAMLQNAHVELHEGVIPDASCNTNVLMSQNGSNFLLKYLTCSSALRAQVYFG